jgi:hypothetical protein
VEDRIGNISAFEWQGESNNAFLQGFTDSPNLLGQVLEHVLEEFSLPFQMNLLHYVKIFYYLDILRKKGQTLQSVS